MKTKKTKSLVALLLALVMVLTSFPIVSFADAQTDAETDAVGYTWTEVAKTDFTTGSRTWTKNTSVSADSKYVYNNFETTGMAWSLCEYSTTSDDPFNAAAQDNADGLTINNGYLYLSRFNNTTVFPTYGKTDDIKIDIAFKYTGASSVSEADKTPFMILTTNSGSMTYDAKNHTDMKNDSYFAQDLYGKYYVNGTGTRSGGAEWTDNSWVNYSMGTDNQKINIGETYHYVFYYFNGFISSALMDEAGNIVVQGCGNNTTVSPDTITGLVLGDDNDSYYLNNVCYKSVTISTGKSGSSKQVEGGRDKYLFAYFTGNDDQNVRLAVSDDGYNFESLNGNKKVLNNNTSACYPSSTTNTGIIASGNARDPFIMRKPEGQTGYYVIATDLDINASTGTGYSNTKLLVWDVEDLSKIGDVQPWNVETCDWFSEYDDLRAYRLSKNKPEIDFFAWAPEAIWDKDANGGQGAYMLYWTSSLIYFNGGHIISSNDNWEGNAQKRVYCAYTSDFQDFYIDKNLTTPCGSGQDPMTLFDFEGTTSIDANITYDGNLYYLYYKNEDEKKLYYAVSENANGPYAGNKRFVGDSSYSDRNIEGCEVYQLYDGSYTLIGDVYEDGSGSSNYAYDGYFAMYNTTAGLRNFGSSNISNAYGLNYLTPRHGHVVNITTAEYEALIAKYGKITYDTNGIRDNTDVNDTLVARYFTTTDVTADTSESGTAYTLTTNNNVTSGADSERIYAQFTGSNNSYAAVSGAQMLKDRGLNVKDGITFDWYGKIDTAATYSRFFEVTTASGPGTITSATGTSYLFYGSTNGYATSDGSTETDCWGYSQNSSYNSTGTWRRYTINVTENYVILFIDGKMLGKQYIAGDINDVANRVGATGSTGEGASDSSGSPTYCKEGSQTWLENIFNGNLMFGASSFSGDDYFTGKISDFRIYSKALSPKEIETSIYKLENGALGVDLQSFEENRIFFDPMEDTAINGDVKTAYTNTVTDPVTVDHDGDGDTNGTQGGTANVSVHGYVLDTTAGETACHNGNSTDKSGYDSSKVTSTEGVTIGFGYRPDDSADDTVIFKIGGDSGLTLTKNGILTLNGTALNNGNPVFDVTDLSISGWSHYSIQVSNKSGTDTIVVSVGGEKTAKFTLTDKALSSYLMNNGTLSVTYGQSAAATNAGLLDDFVIYDGVYTAHSLYLQSAIQKADNFSARGLEQFRQIINSMSTTKLYTNITPAYEAYDTLMRYRDSVNIGENKLDNEILVGYYIDLRNAMSDMELYTKPETVEGMDTATSGLTNNIDRVFTQNMLSTYYSNNFIETKVDSDNTVFGLAANNFVWLYDGETVLTAPLVSFGWSKRADGSANKSFLINCYVYSGEIKFGGLGDEIFTAKYNSEKTPLSSITDASSPYDGYWYFDCTNLGNADESTVKVPWAISSSGAKWAVSYQKGVYKPDHRLTQYCYTSGVTTKHQYTYGANYISYTGGAPTVNDNGNSIYWKSFTTGYKFSTLRGSSNYTYDTSTLTSQTIYVVNYVPVKNALYNSDNINNLKEIVKDVTKASVIDYVQAYDNLTSMNYLTQANEADVTALATALEKNVNVLNQTSYTDADGNKIDNTFAPEATFSKQTANLVANTNFNTISNYENKAGFTYSVYDYANNQLSDAQTLTVTDADGNEVQPEFTTSSWQNYVDSTQAIKDYFTNLDPSTASRNNEYASTDKFYAIDTDGDGTVADAGKGLIEVMENAKVKLVVVADFEPVETPTKTAKKSLTTTDADGKVVQQYSYSTWRPYSDSYDYAVEVNGWDHADTPKYNVNADGYSGIDKNTWTDGTNDTVDRTSAEQSTIDTVGGKVDPSVLKAPADYSVYDAAVNLLKYQDVAVFSDAYLYVNEVVTNEDGTEATVTVINPESVYGIVDAQGTSEKTVRYSNGVSSPIDVATPEPAVSATSLTVANPAYTEGGAATKEFTYNTYESTAYVYDADLDGVFKNRSATEQETLDSNSRTFLNKLSTANNSTTGSSVTGKADPDRRVYDVTFKVIDINAAEGTYISNATSTYYYGATNTFDLTTLINQGYSSVKWTIEYDGVVKQIPAAAKYTATIQGATVVTAYVVKDKPADTVPVKILNIYEICVNELNCTDGSEFTINNDYIPNGTDVPSYTFVGWSVNGKALVDKDGNYINKFTVSDDYKNKNGEIVIKPIYTAGATKYIITLDGTAVESNADFDKLVKLSSSVTDAYAIAVKLGGDYYVVSYDTANYPFYVAGSADYYTVTRTASTVNEKTVYTYAVNGNSDYQFSEDNLFLLNNGLPFASGMGLEQGSDYSLFSTPSYSCKTANSTVTITEMGTLYTLSDATAAMDAEFVIGTAGVYQRVAKNPDQLSSQYFYTLYNANASAGRYCAMRPYVKYKATVTTAAGDTAVIQGISYGNITQHTCTNAQ